MMHTKNGEAQNMSLVGRQPWPYKTVSCCTNMTETMEYFCRKLHNARVVGLEAYDLL